MQHQCVILAARLVCTRNAASDLWAEPSCLKSLRSSGGFTSTLIQGCVRCMHPVQRVTPYDPSIELKQSTHNTGQSITILAARSGRSHVELELLPEAEVSKEGTRPLLLVPSHSVLPVLRRV
jgi:hypothetical protein